MIEPMTHNLDNGNGRGKVMVEDVLVEAQSPSMRTIEHLVRHIADSSVPVLLLGEPGTGKKTLALRIHSSRPRRGAFREIRCGSDPAENFASLLVENLAAAAGGTVYVNEICGLNLTNQAELLVAFWGPPLGGNGSNGSHKKPLGAPEDVRLICSTARSPEEVLQSGRLHEELYFRISGVCLRVPPLRHRREDIPSLAEFLLQRSAERSGTPVPQLDAESQRRLVEYAWPGNVRELESVCRQLCHLGNDAATLRLFLENLTQKPAPIPSNGDGDGMSLKQAGRAASWQAERELILKTLERTRWNRKRAAVELRISYKALLYKLKMISQEESLRVGFAQRTEV